MTRENANLPVNYAEQLEREAQEIAKRLATPSGDRIRFNSNRGFVTPDGLEGESLDVVIVDFMSSNQFYDGVYDRDNPQPPACFAIGPEPSMLVPSGNSPDKQAETCSSCPNNQFGSALTGKGKACKNTRLLAMVPAAVLDDPDAETPLWVMSVPPTSMKSFDAYAHGLSVKHKTIPIGVVTNITMDEKSTFAAPRFREVRKLTDEEIGLFMARREEASQRLTVEPDVSQYKAPVRSKGRR